MNELTKVESEKYLYRRPTGKELKNGTAEVIYYMRVVRNGRESVWSLGVTSITTAREMRDEWILTDRGEAMGITLPKSKKKFGRRDVLITDVLDLYHKDGHPDKNGNPRVKFLAGDDPGKVDPIPLKIDPGFEVSAHMKIELSSYLQLRDYWEGKGILELRPKAWTQYRKDRQQASKRGADCGKLVDLHKNCLSSAFKWAIHQEMKGVQFNPMDNIGNFHSYTKAKHCKSFAPQTPEELHEVVNAVFNNDPRSEGCGWVLLFEAATGGRSAEIAGLRFDAQPNEPGYILGDDLTVRRAKKADRENPFARITPDLKVIMEAHQVWHDRYYKGNPYYFPNVRKAPGKNQRWPHIAPEAATKSLDRLVEKGILKRKYTSHGMRAYYVLVRRSWGIKDIYICTEINQIGGTRTLEISYGLCPPEWQNGNGPKLSWLPSDPTKYAWANLLAAA